MKTFFLPNRPRFKAPEVTTAIPRETEEGVVFDHLSDDEIRDRYAHDNAMELDPAYLVSKGIDPTKFSGAIISPLDAHEQIIDSFNDSLASMPKDEPTNEPSTDPTNQPSTEPTNN